jgi:hypothetical protein
MFLVLFLKRTKPQQKTNRCVCSEEERSIIDTAVDGLSVEELKILLSP